MDRKPKIYLAGTYSVTNYKDDIVKGYGHIFDFIDPFKEVDHSNSHDYIVRSDLKYINLCEVFIAYIEYPTFGTSMEIKFASDLGKLVIVVTPEKKFHNDPWLYIHATKIYSSLYDCMNEILKFYGYSNKRILKPIKEQNIKGDIKMTENSNMGEQANKGLVKDDSKTSTRLLDKQWSPLIVRKYQAFGWPLFIGLICDASLSDLDEVVYKAIDEAKENGMVENDIQSQRNFCGFLSEKITNHYDSVKRGCVEGIAVLAYWDKSFCSSLYGDFMVHASCKQELFSIIQTLPHI